MATSPLRRRTLAAAALLAAGALAACSAAADLHPSHPGTTRTANEAPHDHLWNTPNASIYTDPHDLITDVSPHAGDHTALRVVTVSDVNGAAKVAAMTVKGADVAEDTITAAQDDPNVVAVSVDSPVHLLAEAATSTATSTSNDTYRSQQWALNTLKAETVWGYANGTGATVAVIDTGVNGTHPDLAGRVRSGAEFLAGGSKTSTGNGQTDGNSHGTHVAGIIAAVANNATGVAGLAPGASILPVRVLDSSGSGWNSDVATGIIWATDHGAPIISMSLGGAADSATQTAVEYAVNHGVLVIAAGGNDRSSGSPTSYPGAYPGVLAVASTTSTNTYSSFSNQGAYIDIAAPGSSILSTVPGGYGTKSGTSMATPYVSATAALLYDATNGTVGANQLAATLTSTATDLGTPGNDTDYGAGLVNPLAAVCTFVDCGTAATDPTTTPSDPTTTPPTTDPAPDPGPGTGLTDLAQTELLVDATDAYVWYGGYATMRAQLLDVATGQPIANQPVTIYGYQAGRPAFTKTALTDPGGRVTVTTTLTHTTRMEVNFAATSTYAAATALIGTYRVLPRVRVIYHGSAARVRVKPAMHQVVRFQKLVRGHWVTRKSHRTGRRGLARIHHLGRGTWRVHVTRAPGITGVSTSSWRVW